MLRFLVLGSLVVLFCFACTRPPGIRWSELQTKEATLPQPGGEDAKDKLQRLLKRVQGTQIGDRVFLEESSARWLLPEVDALYLRLASEKNELGEPEYRVRLKRLQGLHQKYLAFGLELSMPFYSAWTQTQLKDFLLRNLVVTLENGDGQIYAPERKVFVSSVSTGKPKNSYGKAEGLKVTIPMRVFFAKEHPAGLLVSERTSRLVLKLRLRESPPFRIGFFDEKFYQGFVWNVEQD